MDAVIYVHGKGGSAAEAEHYRPLFPACDVIGLEYRGETVRDAGQEIHEAVAELSAKHGRLILIANSIGAYYAMNAEIEGYVAHAFFISPVVDMEKLITDGLRRAGVPEEELRERGVIPADFGEDLSWEYLCFVREHPVRWDVPTDILYGSEDDLTSLETMRAFARAHQASLTVLDGGGHWFHTDREMRFLDDWIGSHLKKKRDNYRKR